MEEALALSDLDLIFSIYAIGWTRWPTAILRNLAAYLKPVAACFGAARFIIIHCPLSRLVFSPPSLRPE